MSLTVFGIVEIDDSAVTWGKLTDPFPAFCLPAFAAKRFCRSHVLMTVRLGVESKNGSMRTDAELLREFVERRDESAFTELMNRHLNVVYSAACRETQGDFSAAEDVTNLVFIELVRKAATLESHPSLAGWLYTSVRYISANLRCANHHRRFREQEGWSMKGLLQPASIDSTW